jgi:transposase
MKKDGRSHSHETLEEFRMLGIERIKKGESPGAVAESYGMHRSWGYRIAKLAAGRGRGKRALKSTLCTGRPPKLTPAQEREVFRCMDGKHPHQYGFDFALWSRAIVAAFVLERFDVVLSVTSVGTMLKRLGLTVQKPLKRAYQRNPEAIAQWTDETFPSIAAQAKSDNADIYFWDESGFRADSVYGKTWALKGQTPVVQVPGQRQSISAASAVNSKGGFWFATYQGAMDGEVFVELLQKMMHKRKKPVHLVVDGLPAHKRLIVKEYVQSTNGKLTMHFLPGYAPDLNPDELVWSHTKRSAAKRGPLKSGEKLQTRVDEELTKVKENPALVRQFFKHPTVSYISDL